MQKQLYSRSTGTYISYVPKHTFLKHIYTRINMCLYTYKYIQISYIHIMHIHIPINLNTLIIIKCYIASNVLDDI